MQQDEKSQVFKAFRSTYCPFPLGESASLEQRFQLLQSVFTVEKVRGQKLSEICGYGYVGEYVVERLWRDAKLLEIGGGTLEGHQKNITRDLADDSDAIER